MLYLLDGHDDTTTDGILLSGGSAVDDGACGRESMLTAAGFVDRSFVVLLSVVLYHIRKMSSLIICLCHE